MLTFRIDDVSNNTDIYGLKAMISFLNAEFDCEVWCCVSPVSKKTGDGSVYPGAPFKHNVRSFFYDVDQIGINDSSHFGICKIVSHGLFHVDHSAFQYDAQEMSIVASYNLLKTNTFVPPFNKYNETTEAVCRQNKIKLIKSNVEGWRSLEHNEFNANHNLWYFHPWRFNAESFKRAVTSDGVGLLQGNTLHGS